MIGKSGTESDHSSELFSPFFLQNLLIFGRTWYASKSILITENDYRKAAQVFRDKNQES